MSQQIPIHPDQAPQLLAQYKAELEAVNYVLELKNQAMTHINEMFACMEGLGSPMSTAMIHFAEVQKLEYSMQIKGFTEKRSQLEDIIRQLESPLSIPSLVPPKMPPFPPSGGRRQ
jgi:hypothetical protein